MTATNHMLAGAVVAISVQQPLLVAVFAIASHFFLDVLPHFGVLESDTKERNNHPLFRSILLVDILFVVCLLVLLPFAFDGTVSWWVVLIGMVGAWIPDIIWIRHFIHDHRGTARPDLGRLTRFHQKIQWFEKPVGIIVELVWLAGMGTMLLLLN